LQLVAEILQPFRGPGLATGGLDLEQRTQAAPVGQQEGLGFSVVIQPGFSSIAWNSSLDISGLPSKSH
jgi:hypothetical protein